MDDHFTNLLEEHHLRITTPRKRLFEALKKASQPLSITELITQLPTVDKVSIYRTIDLFTKLSITTAITHGWKQRYELAAPFRPHHHHLVCRNCSKTTEIHSKKIESLITVISAEEGFTPLDHMFEITGLCRQCKG